jgi:hypothetical protein
MSDFFTKKQKKFWCEDCKIFIEYSSMSIEQHKRSKKHQYMINREQIYKNQKAKIQKHTNYLDSTTSTPNLLGHKTVRQIETQSNSMNNILLDEIRKEKFQEQMRTKYNKYPKSKKEKTWSVYNDTSSGEPYYYNFITKESQWERPEDYDGPEIDKPKAYTEKDKKGLVGQWEFVKNNDSIFGKKSTADEQQALPGVVDRDYYDIQEFGDEYSDEDIGQNDDNDIKASGSETIDKYIYEDSGIKSEVNESKAIPKGKEVPEFNLNKEELVEVNEKLKKYDTDNIIFVDPLKEDNNINVPEQSENNNVQITFRQIKKKDKKPIIL